MANETLIERLSSDLGQAATVRNVFGDPIQAGDKTLIPVAKISYGFGGGQGHGSGKRSGAAEPERNDQPGGAGGGGGLHACAKGVFEITPTGTRFVPAGSWRPFLAGVVLGCILRHLFFSGRR